MKLKILNIDAKDSGEIEMPVQFNEGFRPDLIKRAVIRLNSRSVQRYGSKPDAGMRASAKISRRRNDYKTSYGYGISRVPRKILSHRGNRFSWQGAVAPGTVGGRKAHGPNANKKVIKGMNKKERSKALRCAISATVMADIVEARGHRVPSNYPFVISNDFEKVNKTSSLLKSLKALGLDDELERVGQKSIRAGKGTMRNRKYKRKVGPLLVVSDDCELSKVTNLAGVEIKNVSELNALSLAPGANSGRMTLYTESSLKKMKEDKLFL